MSTSLTYADPYLTSQYAIQFALGVQEGEDPRYNYIDYIS